MLLVITHHALHCTSIQMLKQRYPHLSGASRSWWRMTGKHPGISTNPTLTLTEITAHWKPSFAVTDYKRTLSVYIHTDTVHGKIYVPETIVSLQVSK